MIKVRQFENGSLKLRKVELAAKNIEKIDEVIFQAPSGARAEIRELAVLVGGIPALNDHIKVFWRIIGTVEFQPFSLDDDARGRLGVLLILRDKIVLGHRAAVAFQRGRRE